MTEVTNYDEVMRFYGTQQSSIHKPVYTYL
jgi:hypothetical protein